MGRQQFRLLVCSATAIALLAGSLLAIPWFRIDLLGSAIEIDLQSASACSTQSVCMSIPLSKLQGLYPATATVSFYAGLLLLLVVIVQSASKIVTGAVHDTVTRIGYILAVATIVCGFSAGYLFGPDGQGIATSIASITVERTWAPFVFMLGTLSAFAALYYASSEITEDVVEYKPIQIDKRLPVTPLTNKIVTRQSGSIPLEGAARNARPPTQPPFDRRPSTPSGGLRTVDLRSKTPSSSGRTMTPTGGSRIDDLRSPPLSPPTRSLTPGGSFSRTDPTGRSMTPGGGFSRTDPSGRALTPGTGFARTDSQGRSLTPGGGFARTDAQGRSLTPGGGFARTPGGGGFGRDGTSPGTGVGRDGTSPGGFARDATTPGGGFVRIDETRTRAPSQPGETRTRPPTQPPFARTEDTRTRPPTQPPFARIEDTRTKSPSQQGFGDPTRTKTSSQQPFGTDPTRTKTSSQQPFVTAPTRERTSSQQPFGTDPTRTKTSSQQPFGTDPTRTKTSSQQPFVARTTSPGIADSSRPKSSSQQPFVARTTSPQQPFVARTTSPSGIADPSRTKAPSHPPIDPVARARTSSSGPIDLAARLSASVPNPLEGAPNLAVSIRPPLPTPEPVPPDQIPVDPAAGLTIRKRTASAAPHSELTLAPVTGTPVTGTPVTGMPIASAPALPDDAFAPPVASRPSAAAPSEKSSDEDSMPRITVDGLENLAEAITSASKLGEAAPVADTPPAAKTHELPEYIRGKLKFAVLTAELASAGIKARREDGLDKLVKWDDVVGIVARRLPPEKPFEGATVVDLLSRAGATLRIVPWTKLDGHPFESKAVERARSFVNVVAAMALEAKLDSATKLFANGDGDAAQLPNVAALATHDSKVG